MGNCYLCKRKIAWGSKTSKLDELKSHGRNIPQGMTEKDQICEVCIKEGKTSANYKSSPTLPSSSSTTPSQNNTIQTPKQDPSKNSTVEELRGFVVDNHDKFKERWNKDEVIQFKDDSIAILKRVVGSQVQFITAFSKITNEGYRLMAIDEGMEVKGTGVSGGINAFFYFQKIDLVK